MYQSYQPVGSQAGAQSRGPVPGLPQPMEPYGARYPYRYEARGILREPYGLETPATTPRSLSSHPPPSTPLPAHNSTLTPYIDPYGSERFTDYFHRESNESQRRWNSTWKSSIESPTGYPGGAGPKPPGIPQTTRPQNTSVRSNSEARPVRSATESSPPSTLPVAMEIDEPRTMG